MGKKIATRAAYGDALVRLGAVDPDLVVLDADLSGSTMTKNFAKAYPDRFFNMGIAEANMAGVAAGLAASGKKPFYSSFAMFAAGRAWEQVRNSIAYPHLNVKIAATHAGLSVGEDGATHQCIEDLAIMRAIPGMTVVCPCDAYETEKAVEALLGYEGPAYLRLGRLGVETVTDSVKGYRFRLGKGALLRKGTDVTIVATGMMVQMALAAAETLAKKGIEARVIDMFTWQPLDEELIIESAKKTGAVVVAENHRKSTGLGNAVASVLAENIPTPMGRIGIGRTYGEVGSLDYLMEKFHLTAADIAEKAKETIARK